MEKPKTLQVALGDRSYPVHVGTEAQDKLLQWFKERPDVEQIVVISDQTVATLHLDRLNAALPGKPLILTFQPGEVSKSLATVAGFYDALARARIERAAVIVTFGGGVAGDLGGFVAATWLRGIRYIQVPTTLLAAVDASVGGKTGVDLPAGKNLVGAFHQPQAVIIDPVFLQTLPQRDFTAGLAESVKHAAIRHPDFLGWHEVNANEVVSRSPGAVTELIARNCTIKAEVVQRDEREAGWRAILNHGHTIGHAIEHLLGYELRHGECVALGMLVENELACARQALHRADADRIHGLLERLGLPVRLPRPVAAERVAELCRIDKKVRGGAVHFILLHAIGEPQRVVNVSDAEIAAALRVIEPG